MYFLFGIAIPVAIFHMVLTPVRVVGTSMEPTLVENDIGMIETMTKTFHRGDIVMISTNPHEPRQNKEIIKRVIALPGETIHCKDNRVFVDQQPLQEAYLAKGTWTEDFPPITLQKDEYFCLGDHREISLDSRSLGPFQVNQIEGRWLFKTPISTKLSHTIHQNKGEKK